MICWSHRTSSARVHYKLWPWPRTRDWLSAVAVCGASKLSKPATSKQSSSEVLLGPIMNTKWPQPSASLALKLCALGSPEATLLTGLKVFQQDHFGVENWATNSFAVKKWATIMSFYAHIEPKTYNHTLQLATHFNFAAWKASWGTAYQQYARNLTMSLDKFIVGSITDDKCEMSPQLPMAKIVFPCKNGLWHLSQMSQFFLVIKSGNFLDKIWRSSMTLELNWDSHCVLLASRKPNTKLSKDLIFVIFVYSMNTEQDKSNDYLIIIFSRG